MTRMEVLLPVRWSITSGPKMERSTLHHPDHVAINCLARGSEDELEEFKIYLVHVLVFRARHRHKSQFAMATWVS